MKNKNILYNSLVGEKKNTYIYLKKTYAMH